MKKSIFKVMSMLLIASTMITFGGCKKNQPNNSASTSETSVTHVHTFANNWSKNETEHWHAATCKHKDETKDKAKHTWDEGKVTTPASEEKEGIKTFTCTVCNQIKTETIEKLLHTHTFANEWSFDDAEHWHAATCKHNDEKKDLEAHIFDEGVMTTEPGYGVEGVKTFTCTICKKTKTENIAALTPFFMPINEVYSVNGGKTVVTGTIYSGVVKTGDTLTLSGLNKNVTIASIEKYKKTYESASEGENVGLLIEGATKDQIQSGYSLFTPATKKYYNQIKVNLTALTKEEGGRKTPFFSNYTPQIKLYPNDVSGTTYYAGEVTGCIILPSSLECFMPGETHEITIILKVDFILDKGMKLVVVESGKKIAYGTITALEQHEHDDNYDEKGICNACGFDQYLSFNYDSSFEEYSYETNLEVNNKLFFKITTKSEDTIKEWRVDIYGTTYDKYEVIIYDSNYKELQSSYMVNYSTYYIVVIGKDNVNDITIKVVDSNDM